ncbi:MAG: hypothetical protein H7328_01190 [Bdellovibrio sp.]|nr:hypothetical protein [Bdellovibrio sp.]
MGNNRLTQFKVVQDIQKIQSPSPAIREVQPLVISAPEQQNVIAVYKDLGKAATQTNQKNKIFMVFGITILVGVGILLGSNLNKKREVASTFAGFTIPAGGVQKENYQYAKSCYEGENGEQVCMTRSSVKKPERN